MAIRMRRGLESELDISKSVPGEWLVSTDTKYVRMCFAPGIVLRMATYEAFEEDMEQIKAILEESKTVEEAIQKIYNDVQEVVIDIETASNAAQTAIEKSKETEDFAISASSSASSAKTSESNALKSENNSNLSALTASEKAEDASIYADNAEKSANTANTHATTASDKATEAINSALLAESYAVGGTGTRPNENTDNAKYYYEQTKNISIPGLEEGIALNRQTLGYSKKNLLKNTATSTTNNGVTFVVNEDGSITANGTATADSVKTLGNFVPIPNAKYIFTGNEKVNDNGYSNNICFIDGIDGSDTWHAGAVDEKKYIFTPKTNATITCRICIKNGTTVENLTFYPMIRSAEITDGTYEPYVDDVDTRLNDLKSELEELAYVVEPMEKYNIVADGETDNLEGIQNYISDNAGKIIYFPPGTYRVSEPIRVPSNTTLVGYGATILGDSNLILLNDADGVTGGTLANENISIIGFEFAPTHDGNCGSIAFGHANNMQILNCKFRDNASWHMIEINSCDNVEINNCTFSNYGAVEPTEIIQLDFMSGAMVFPAFGPYDNTPCTNIRINRCSFYGNVEINASAIGNHTTNSSEIVRNIKITDCYFKDLANAFFFLIGNNITIENCIAENVSRVFFGYYNVDTVKFVNNIFIGRDIVSSLETERGIYIAQNDSLTMHDIEIRNNIIEKFGSHGITIQTYNNVLDGNIIRNNGGHGLYIGYEEHNSVYSGNSVYNNNAGGGSFVDVYVNHHAGSDANVGDILVTGNKMGTVRFNNSNPVQKSYFVNNVVKEASKSIQLENMIISNNYGELN